MQGMENDVSLIFKSYTGVSSSAYPVHSTLIVFVGPLHVMRLAVDDPVMLLTACLSQEWK